MLSSFQDDMFTEVLNMSIYFEENYLTRKIVNNGDKIYETDKFEIQS